MLYAKCMARKRFPRELILDLVRQGVPVTDVAKRLGISRQTVHTAIREARVEVAEGKVPAGLARPKRRAKANGSSSAATGEAAPETPDESVPERLLERLTGLARKAMDKLEGQLDEGRPGNAYAYTAAILTQRAVECQRYMDQRWGVPKELPEDQRERDQVLQRIAYRRALGGSASGLREALAAVAKDSRIEVVWGQEDHAADAGTTAATPAAPPRQ